MRGADLPLQDKVMAALLPQIFKTTGRKAKIAAKKLHSYKENI